MAMPADKEAKVDKAALAVLAAKVVTVLSVKRAVTWILLI